MQRGITLVEVILLLVIVAAAVLVLLPTVADKGACANEINTIGALKTYCTAQTTYKVNNYSLYANGGNPAWQECYAPSVQNLGGRNAHWKADGTSLELIPDVFANATDISLAFQGYFFCDIPKDAKGNLHSAKNWHDGHGLSGSPAVWDKTGTNTYAIDETGVVLMKDFGAQGAPGQVPQAPDPTTDPTWILP